MWTNSRLTPKRLAVLAAAFSLCLLAAVLIVSLSSCERGDLRGTGQAPVPREPLRFDGVPIIRVRLRPGPIAQATVATAGPCRVYVDGRAVAESDGPMPPTAVTRRGASWRIGAIEATGRLVSVEPLSASEVAFERAAYRGALLLLPRGDDLILAVNRVDLESYLAGVLSAELYPQWHEETYRAQAIAARTFALFHRLRAEPDADYHVGSDQSYQVYKGLAAETDRSWQAVRATHGVVLAVGPDGGERIFMAQYSSCCGGVVNGADVIRTAPDLEPLRGGQADPHCHAAPRYRWDDVRIAKDDLYLAIAAAYPQAARLGGVRSVEVTSATDYGRAVWVRIAGRNRRADGAPESIVMRAEDLRLALIRTPAGRKLYSMNCQIEDAGGAVAFRGGRGHGHGVGLCQWGAEGKAQAGWSAEQILDFYYPGARRIRVYEP